MNFEVNSHTETRTDQQTSVTVNIIAPPYQPPYLLYPKRPYPYHENPNSRSISTTQHNFFNQNENQTERRDLQCPIDKNQIKKPPTTQYTHTPTNPSKKLKILTQLLEDSDEDSDECIEKMKKKTANEELKEKAQFQTFHKLPSIKQGYVKNTNNIVRHNPWGSISYKELITEAILDQPAKKAKLQEIYEYMIQHYEYFQNRSKAKDERRKQWTNSVRHNLSSHGDVGNFFRGYFWTVSYL